MKILIYILNLIILVVLGFVIFAVVSHQTPEVLSLGFEEFALVLGSQSQYYCFETASVFGLLVAFLFGVVFGGFVLPISLLLKVLEELKKL